jgi:hypothetical protein
MIFTREANNTGVSNGFARAAALKRDLPFWQARPPFHRAVIAWIMRRAEPGT